MKILSLFFLFVMMFSTAQTCTKKIDCHKDGPRAEISYDDVINELSVQVSMGTAPFFYTWSTGAGNVVRIVPPGPGTYSVTVSDLNDCKAIAHFTIH